MAGNIEKIAYSATSLFRALGYVLQNRWAWRYIFSLLLFNFLSFVLTIVVLFFPIIEVLNRVLDALGNQSDFLAGILLLLAVATSILLAIVIFSFVSSIVSAPIFGLFSDRMRYEDKIDRADFAAQYSKWQLIRRAIVFEVKKLLLILFFAIITFPINLIPVVGQGLYFAFNLLQIIVITGLDLLAPYLELRIQTFKGNIKFILDHPTELWPLLVISGLLGVIPVVNLLTIPLAIVAVHLVYKKYLITD